MGNNRQTIRLTVAIDDHGATRALKDGRVGVPGCALTFADVEPILTAYRRMVRHVEFDICQLTPTTYMIAKAKGAPYTALPVFLSRRFHHAGLICKASSGMHHPKDLEGRRVGARSYTLTTAVWSRGIYAAEYGLDCGRVAWIVNDEEHITDLNLPENVHRVPRETSLTDMLESGYIDAAFVSKKDMRHLPPGKYRDLFDDPAPVEREWYQRTGIYPMHALVVVKDEVIKNQPLAIKGIQAAFGAAHDAWVDDLHSGRELSSKDKAYLELSRTVGRDPLPYGVEANRPSILALHDYAMQQGFLPRALSVEEMFVPD